MSVAAAVSEDVTIQKNIHTGWFEAAHDPKHNDHVVPQTDVRLSSPVVQFLDYIAGRSARHISLREIFDGLYPGQASPDTQFTPTLLATKRALREIAKHPDYKGANQCLVLERGHVCFLKPGEKAPEFESSHTNFPKPTQILFTPTQEPLPDNLVEKPNSTHDFGWFTVNAFGTGRIRYEIADTEITFSKKSFRFLELLAQHSGTFTPRNKVIDTLFPNATGATQNISNVFSDLRKTLVSAAEFIEGFNVEECLLKQHGGGFCFLKPDDAKPSTKPNAGKQAKANTPVQQSGLRALHFHPIYGLGTDTGTEEITIAETTMTVRKFLPFNGGVSDLIRIPVATADKVGYGRVNADVFIARTRQGMIDLHEFCAHNRTEKLNLEAAKAVFKKNKSPDVLLAALSFFRNPNDTAYIHRVDFLNEIASQLENAFPFIRAIDARNHLEFILSCAESLPAHIVWPYDDVQTFSTAQDYIAERQSNPPEKPKYSGISGLNRNVDLEPYFARFEERPSLVLSWDDPAAHASTAADTVVSIIAEPTEKPAPAQVQAKQKTTKQKTSDSPIATHDFGWFKVDEYDRKQNAYIVHGTNIVIKPDAFRLLNRLNTESGTLVTRDAMASEFTDVQINVAAGKLRSALDEIQASKGFIKPDVFDDTDFSLCDQFTVRKGQGLCFAQPGQNIPESTQRSAAQAFSTAVRIPLDGLYFHPGYGLGHDRGAHEKEIAGTVLQMRTFEPLDTDKGAIVDIPTANMQHLGYGRLNPDAFRERLKLGFLDFHASAEMGEASPLNLDAANRIYNTQRTPDILMMGLYFLRNHIPGSRDQSRPLTTNYIHVLAQQIHHVTPYTKIKDVKRHLSFLLQYNERIPTDLAWPYDNEDTYNKALTYVTAAEEKFRRRQKTERDRVIESTRRFVNRALEKIDLATLYTRFEERIPLVHDWETDDLDVDNTVLPADNDTNDITDTMPSRADDETIANERKHVADLPGIVDVFNAAAEHLDRDAFLVVSRLYIRRTKERMTPAELAAEMGKDVSEIFEMAHNARERLLTKIDDPEDSLINRWKIPARTISG